MSNTKPGHDTGTRPEVSDKDGRNTSVTNRAGQATPRCQAYMSIRQSEAAITSGCHASLRGGSDCMRVGWHTCENKLKLFIQVYSSIGGSRSILCDD